MGTGDPKSTQESTSDLLKALAMFAPAAIKAINTTVGDTARTNLAANQEVSPGQAKLDSEISAAQNLAASKSELGLAQGPGRDLVREAVAMQKVADPEASHTRELVGAGLDKYLAGFNGGALTPTELEQINRGIAQGGDANLAPSALKTLNNARTFGDAGTAKWGQFGQALSTASSMIPQLQSGLPAFEIATRRAVTPSNPANAQAASQTNFGFANNALNNITSAENAQVAKRKTFDERVNAGISSLSGIY